MKLKTKEQGVVLVITLIMLSVVTLMAIVFLGVSRRERIVNVTTDHLTAKMAAEAGMARAQSEVIGRVLSSSKSISFRLRRVDQFRQSCRVRCDGHLVQCTQRQRPTAQRT